MASIIFDEGSSRGFKRPRPEFATPHHRRPINKSLITILQAGNDATDTTTALLAVAFPCTSTGLRWNLTFTQDAGTAVAFFYWAIVVLYDGSTQDTLVTTDGGTFYQPEKNVLAFGSGTIDNNVETKTYIGSTKTMRKLQVGDALIFIAKGSATNTTRCDGIVQFFCKT